MDAGLKPYTEPPPPPPSGTSAITGRVWLDMDENRIRDAGEKGIAGLVVFLYDGIGNFMAFTFTDAEGNYTFGSLAAGTYQVQISAGSNSTFSPQDMGNDDSVDSDVNSTGWSNPITLGEDEVLLNLDAGLLPLGDFEPIYNTNIGAGSPP